MKKCPKCGRTSPPALAFCPRCRTPFNAPATAKQEGNGPARKTPETSGAAGGAGKSRKTAVVISGVVLLAMAVAGGFYLLSGNMYDIKTKSLQLAQGIQGRQWKYPPGDAAETARVMSVQQLIEAWKTVPGRSQTLIHSTYAKALGLKGREALSAIPVLAPYVTDKDLYLRQGAMEGLAGIGEEGLPHILKALNYRDKADTNDVTIRWDAAMAIAKMGPRAKNAEKELLAAIINPEENVNVKGDAAAALAGIGPDAVPSLNRARCYFYDKGGTSVAETGVLRTINIALQGMNAAMEPCKGLGGGQQGADQGAPVSSPTFLSASDLGRMQTPQLLDALRSNPYNKQMIADELVRRGAQAEAVEALQAMLRDKEQKGLLGIKMALSKLKAPVVYDWSRNSFLPIAEDNIGLIEWAAETRNDSVYSSGRIYVGRDVIAGLSRRQQGMVTLPAFVRYTLKVKGGSLAQPVEKIFEAAREGEHSWDNVILASGIGPGKYSVTLFLHAQFAKEDGTGRILNNNAGFLEIER